LQCADEAVRQSRALLSEIRSHAINAESGDRFDGLLMEARRSAKELDRVGRAMRACFRDGGES
jgi:hypothetical protein